MQIEKLRPLAITILVVTLAFIFWPWAVAISDLVMWMVAGTRVTGVEWFGWRGLAMIGWPVVWVCAFFLATRGL